MACFKTGTYEWRPKPKHMDGMKLDDEALQRMVVEWLEEMEEEEGLACAFFNPTGDCLFRRVAEPKYLR